MSDRSVKRMNNPFELPRQEDSAWWDWLEKAQDELPAMMRSSTFFVGICPSGDPDAKFCVELGMAIMFDKPLLIIVQKGQSVPAGLLRIAHRIVEVEHSNPKEAVVLVTDALKEFLPELAREGES